MRLGIKAKQVLGVTSIVGVVVVALSLMHLAALARLSLRESEARAALLQNAIFHRAREVVASAADPQQAMRDDPGLRSILESSLYSNNVTFAAIVDRDGRVIAHADPSMVGRMARTAGSLEALVAEPSWSLLRTLYSDEGRDLELRQPLLLGEIEFGSIRIGVSTVLIRRELSESLVRPAIVSGLVALAIAVAGAMLLAQRLLRPIHVIRTGLTRLGRGELGVRLDLDQRDEFGELGTFFNTASEQLSADRSQMAGQVAHLESAVEHLEDAVGIVSPKGDLIFANPAMRAILPSVSAGTTFSEALDAGHPLRRVFEETLTARRARGPVSVTLPAGGGGESGERTVLTHLINDANGALVGIMMTVRNVEYLSQVQQTIRYSRKLAALGRLSAGVAHEVKNPLNAMMIHLELLRQQFRPPARAAAHAKARGGAAVTADEPPSLNTDQAFSHVEVIAGEIKRLDEVVQGFLKFTRPEDLRLHPVDLAALCDEVVPILQPEADRRHVRLVVDCGGLPDVNGDSAMLRQAFLNLALNACQAMPNGGTLTIRGGPSRGRLVCVTFTDTGHGIEPAKLGRIFDLYFTTKEKGSGIGLSMVYRTVQMHDGEIEVESTPGVGTTFSVFLPRA